MPKIALTSKADSDLDGIYEHYEPRIGPEKAEENIFQVLDAISRLETFPQLGKASDIPDCRELIISKYPYRAVYRLKGDIILVYRILHQHAERPEDW
ncbi:MULTISPECIES: type II toxin-antitoxin system RelE/ParE family toxin [Pseudomonas]|uniref:type II toxin-antitoxin system RelE/ParE family toxin n=1 Tax=unclassified Pseudomonas TaxID=196821 RepID=UPI001F480755|nr:MULTISPECIES: type II toxin-antitoxin system RelE/ParE family toxin [unclassified Pseudomonas]MCF5507468.1 type II toxin-antitoxin system mRNA interferase toxin, RelE/StbE family [Pseudomonas sp. PA-3-6H]MCF5517215.1 type II toxin-antitoxin system mRNA interferase toxin, RelE/StbE family [Pseudomonas sp. PA-3-6E]MCF5564166.1 type II toxin-antitoxin system mRNA interferase toxin, RelE/StbE family [Pseudomonas sp. PA-3-5D]MCF5566491.1 type II toxin-antitoxin system mRNA interferase toxin, RelE